MMMSSNGNIFRVTGPLCREFNDHLTKASDAELWCFLWIDLHLNKLLSKQSRRAGDLRRHRAHYNVTAMSHGLSSYGIYKVSQNIPDRHQTLDFIFLRIWLNTCCAINHTVILETREGWSDTLLNIFRKLWNKFKCYGLGRLPKL